jgi:2-oxoglutarate ferredoxin oxidoreductase subunit alpha
MEKDFSILIGGEAGQGTRLAGNLIANLFNKLGYFVYVYEDYQSLIRGGHNFSEIVISERKKESREKEIDILIAFDKKTLTFHQKRLKKGGILIFNANRVESKKGVGIFGEKIIKEEGGIPQMINTVFISALTKILGIPFGILEEVLKEKIKKGIELNLKIAQRVYKETQNQIQIKKIKTPPNNILLTGNEATALGLARAGLNFYFGYPMTPATSIMNFLAAQENLGVKVIQPENEISVINMALGVAFAGKRSAVGSSGGGFALMVEALSLAAQSETPILIVESQRAGPSTGMPTYNLQGDLLFVLNAGHGDIPRFVIAPGDAQECALYSALALNLAWKYQTPAILLLDKDLSENTFSVDKKIFEKIKIENPVLWDGKKEYKRYKITKNGISPLAFPGQKRAVVKFNSYEHDEFGITLESEEVKKMQEKRLRKYEAMKREVEKLPAIKIYGRENSKIALVSFGISKGAAVKAAENLKIKLVQPIIIEPFPQKQMEKALRGVRKIFTVELNSTGQLAKVLNQNGIRVDGKILKYNGRPFFAKEIEEKLKL